MTSSDPTGERAPRSLGDREFTKMWLGESVSVLGDQISLFALPSLAILALHASSEQVGYLNAIATAAFPLCATVVGVFTDRVRCRRLMIGADLIRCAAFGVVAFLAFGGSLTWGALYSAAAVTGVCAVVFDVAYQAHLPRLVSESFLATGNARLEASYSLARSAGPALAGLLTQTLGAALTVGVNAVSFLVSAAGLGGIRKTERVPAGTAADGRLRAFTAGMRHLWRHRGLRMLSGAAAIRNFGVAMVDTLFLLFAYRGLHWTPALAGLALTVAAIGGVLGAALARRLVARFGLNRTLLLTCLEGAVWFAVPLALLGQAFAVVAVVAFLSAIWLPVWNITVLTFRQKETPAPLLGRVHAAARTINLAATPLGALTGGVVAALTTRELGDRTGLAVSLVIAGACASSGLPFLLHRDVRRHRTMPGSPTTAPEAAP